MIQILMHEMVPLEVRSHDLSPRLCLVAREEFNLIPRRFNFVAPLVLWKRRRIR